MVQSATFDFPIHHQDRTTNITADDYLPAFVVAMLRNVHLSYDDQSHELSPEGEFWFWKLSSYGLDLMRLLVRTSNRAFSYAATFTEMEIENVPQLMLLSQLNSEIRIKLIRPMSESKWAPILDCHSYLHDQGIVIELELFQTEMEKFIMRIRQGRYSPSGSRVY